MRNFIKKLFIKEPINLEEVYHNLLPKIKPYFEKAIALEKTDTPQTSFIGGLPSVPKNSFSWPYLNDIPLQFIAQIDLSEINNHHISYLPNRGILLFFYDMETQVWGFNPNDKAHFKVIYLDTTIDSASIVVSPEYLEKKHILPNSYVKANEVDTPLPVESKSIDALGLTDTEYDAYADYASINIFDQQPMHQLGGHPSPVQGNDMELEAQLASNGIYCGDPAGYESEKAKLLAEGASEWKLLLQIDSDDTLGIMWGDAGMLYFWVKETEAKEGNFDNVWLILQCG